jgi:alpha-beta hydrolase superfamily lysophospholipase
MKGSKKWLKRFLWIFGIIFVCMNTIAIFHAYKFTHFTRKGIERTKDPKKLTDMEKLKALLLGVNNPRPENKQVPSSPFQTIFIQSNVKLACWEIKTANAKGTVILFHGYSSEKSALLDKAEIFRSDGYNTFLVDFMGSGGSEGNSTTIGYVEAQEVKACYDHVMKNGEKNIFLFGASMGAVAIMKAIYDYELKPAGIIIECPFGTMYKTVCTRFRNMKVPEVPMAALLTFWGGVQNGFWAFGHNPEKYAEKIRTPALLMYGGCDEKVSREEIDDIFNKLAGEKKLVIFPQAGHEDYLSKYKSDWTNDTRDFLEREK